MRNKREYLARMAGSVGALKALERLAGRRPGLVVFTYHRIAEPGADPFYDPVISGTPEGFRAQVEGLARRMRVLALDEAVEQIASGAPWREPSALITFDDGYRDNFEVAAPILRGLGLPATFFLPTGFLEDPRLPWWDEVAFILKRTRADRLDLRLGPDGEDGSSGGMSSLAIDLRSISRSEAIRRVIAAFLDETIRDGRWFLDRLAERAEVEPDGAATARALFADWDEVRRCTGPGLGFSVGSHGHSHRKLAGLDAEAQLGELAGSKRILEERLGREVAALAYPYGWPGAYTAETKALAARAGYRAAFSGIEGINRPGSLDPFEVRRLNVGSGDSAILLRARAALHGALGWSFL